jgi:hypothetical protein
MTSSLITRITMTSSLITRITMTSSLITRITMTSSLITRITMTSSLITHITMTSSLIMCITMTSSLITRITPSYDLKNSYEVARLVKSKYHLEIQTNSPRLLLYYKPYRYYVSERMYYKSADLQAINHLVPMVAPQTLQNLWSRLSG